MTLANFADRLARLGGLTDMEHGVVSALPFSTAKVQRHRDLLRRGERPSYLYIVESGWAARYALRADGSRRITAFMVPGDFCGIHAVCHQPMDHSITALTECEVLRVELHDVERAIETAPGIGKALWQAKLIDEATLRTWMLNSHDAARMLAHLICELHTRIGTAPMAPSAKLQLPITQEHVADALGLTPVHVNRMYRRLREDGLLTFESGTIDIPDLKALHRWAGFDPIYLGATTGNGPQGHGSAA